MGLWRLFGGVQCSGLERLFWAIFTRLIEIFHVSVDNECRCFRGLRWNGAVMGDMGACGGWVNFDAVFPLGMVEGAVGDRNGDLCEE